MTGPEHYKEAEGILAAITDDKFDGADVLAASALAQVHATLALTAATVEAGGLTEADGSGFNIPRYPSWAKAVRPS